MITEDWGEGERGGSLAGGLSRAFFPARRTDEGGRVGGQQGGGRGGGT